MTENHQIVTLCGSARFESWYHLWNRVLSLAGHCVFGLSGYPSLPVGSYQMTAGDKRVLDDVHRHKIAASSAVVFLNPFGYLGESVLNELEHAKALGKEIFFLESWGQGYGICSMHTMEWQRAAVTFLPAGWKGSPIATCNYRPATDLLGPAGARRSRSVSLIEEHKAAVLAGSFDPPVRSTSQL